VTPAARTAAGGTAAADTLKQISHLAVALKAPRITQSAARLADHARDAGWTHEDYLAAVLEREVAARNASGARLRIRAAGMPAVKTLEDFDFDHQPAARTPVQALASGAYLAEHRNVVLLGPPGTGKTHCETHGRRSSHGRRRRGQGCLNEADLGPRLMGSNARSCRLQRALWHPGLRHAPAVRPRCSGHMNGCCQCRCW